MLCATTFEYKKKKKTYCKFLWDERSMILQSVPIFYLPKQLIHFERTWCWRHHPKFLEKSVFIWNYLSLNFTHILFKLRTINTLLAYFYYLLIIPGGNERTIVILLWKRNCSVFHNSSNTLIYFR